MKIERMYYMTKDQIDEYARIAAARFMRQMEAALPEHFAYLEALQEEYPTEETGIVIKTVSRDVWHDEERKYIFLHLHRKNKMVVASYDPALFAFMANPSKAWYQVAGLDGVDERIQIGFPRGRNGKRWYPHLSRFLYFYYKSGLSPDDFRLVAKRVMNRKNPNKWHVDHVNNDIYCDCRWNLALIPAEKNVRSGKTNLVAQIKPPYFCYPIIDNKGCYRVYFGWTGRYFFFRCKTINALISLLRAIMAADFSEDLVPPFITPAEAYERYRDRPADAEDIGSMIAIAELLLAMPSERFTEWTAREQFVQIPARAFFGLTERVRAEPRQYQINRIG